MILLKKNIKPQERKKVYYRRATSRILTFLFVVAAILAGQLYWQEEIDALYEQTVKNLRESDNLALQHVDVVGNDKLTRQYIIAQSNLKVGTNILAVDLNAVHDELKKDGWIEAVSISRIYPNTIRVQISEEKPKALWCKDEKFFLVADNGKVIQEVDAPVKPEHLLIFGDEAPAGYQNIHQQLATYDISSKVVGLSNIGGRRWDLYLNDGSLIMLPENNVEKALILLDKLRKNGIVEQKAVQKLDMRLAPENIFIKYK